MTEAAKELNRAIIRDWMDGRLTLSQATELLFTVATINKEYEQ